MIYLHISTIRPALTTHKPTVITHRALLCFIIPFHLFIGWNLWAWGFTAINPLAHSFELNKKHGGQPAMNYGQTHNYKCFWTKVTTILVKHTGNAHRTYAIIYYIYIYTIIYLFMDIYIDFVWLYIVLTSLRKNIEPLWSPCCAHRALGTMATFGSTGCGWMEPRGVFLWRGVYLFILYI